MIELKPESEPVVDINLSELPVTFHPTYYLVVEKLKKWLSRFYLPDHPSISRDLVLFFLTASKKFLDHRSANHLFRLFFCIHFLQKKTPARFYLFTAFAPSRNKMAFHGSFFSLCF